MQVWANLDIKHLPFFPNSHYPQPESRSSFCHVRAHGTQCHCTLHYRHNIQPRWRAHCAACGTKRLPLPWGAWLFKHETRGSRRPETGGHEQTLPRALPTPDPPSSSLQSGRSHSVPCPKPPCQEGWVSAGAELCWVTCQNGSDTS